MGFLSRQAQVPVDTSPDEPPLLRLMEQGKELSNWAMEKFEEVTPGLKEKLEELMQDPSTLFNSLLVSIVTVTVTIRVLNRFGAFARSAPKKKQSPPKKKLAVVKEEENEEDDDDLKPIEGKYVQWKFLSVFWLCRISFWMSGPYFYAAYASKKINGEPISIAAISQICLAGYAAIAIFGPIVGKFSDQYGRKNGTIAAALLYAIGNTSATWSTFPALFGGRAVAGLGTCLLKVAPESWLVSELKRKNRDPAGFLIGETFGMAYAVDPVVAIFAGQLAGWVASIKGPTAPYELSPVFLLLASTLALIFWDENTAKMARQPAVKPEDQPKQKQQTIMDAVRVVREDRKILCLGIVQALFEGAMYIFVLVWPPSLNAALSTVYSGPDGKTSTPYGTIFSCFMACCMFGSTLFGLKPKKTHLESFSTVLLSIASASMIVATMSVNSTTGGLWELIFAYFIYEACVGVYFPAIGTLRGKFLPDTHRSVIMTLFGVPLNCLVVSVFLFQHKLGSQGELFIASIALVIATICMFILYRIEKKELRKRAIKKLKRAFMSVRFANRIGQSIRKQPVEEDNMAEVFEHRRSYATANVPVF